MDKYEGICFFCEQPVLSGGERPSEEWIELQDIYGKIPERIAGMVGKKVVCKACQLELAGLVREE